MLGQVITYCIAQRSSIVCSSRAATSTLANGLVCMQCLCVNLETGASLLAEMGELGQCLVDPRLQCCSCCDGSWWHGLWHVSNLSVNQGGHACSKDTAKRHPCQALWERRLEVLTCVAFFRPLL
jgi:hypothetical protein